jgi:ATP-dependent Clp protease ATP-binding subunit ClpB
MEADLARRVVGQDEVLKVVSEAVRRARAGLQEDERPIGSFIFLGPTGVGKTETAKALADFMFDDESAIVRIDMSEFMEKHSVARLIGAPPGYVGFDEGGVLTNAIATRPYSVVLFDEIEKAHSDVFNILLQLLDDGRITDSHGKTVDCRNVVVIMTSNIGSHGIIEHAGNREKMSSVAMEACRGHFRPEFLNRIDDIIVFNPLTRENIGNIVHIQLDRLRALLKDREMTLTMKPAAAQLLGDLGYDPAYGARPLKRAILRYLKNPMSMQILDGQFGQGDHVIVDSDGDSFFFLRDESDLAKPESLDDSFVVRSESDEATQTS